MRRTLNSYEFEQNRDLYTCVLIKLHSKSKEEEVVVVVSVEEEEQQQQVI